MSLTVSELFYSIQGEGRLAGAASVFVRLAGCDLRCRWCDSRYAWPSDAGEVMDIDEVVRKVCEHPTPYVVVTGGEPLLSDDLRGLLEELKRAGKHITLETSATEFRNLTVDLMSISPKLSHSTPDYEQAGAEEHERKRLNLTAIRQYLERHDYQLKFVVRDREDLAEIDGILQKLGGVRMDKVLLMPEACDAQTYRQRGVLVAQMCLERGYRFSPRLHLELWGGCRGR